MNTRTESSLGRSITFVFLATATVLMLPLVAMRLTDEVAWTSSDFVFAGVLLAGTGLAYVLATRAAGSRVYRWAVGIALGTALLLIWAIGAVGVIGTERDPANLMYIGVFATLALGTFAARLRPRWMAWAMAATASAQALVALVALVAGIGEPLHGPWEIVLTNGLFVALWLMAAGLFRSAGQPRG
jgi:hypothetical protein